ncbi:uncharacterized protein LOC126965874 [Leptidea sinapis]|uniref:uncharacterized protein LOC126965874 n=1 Tax=Leptidea sinapis TaxID=189913 RepID=UPI00212DDC40|nr:uncharacterized protein LOC126965874 [Leptidea sinapis]
MYCIFVLFTVLSGVLSSQIPDYIKVCKRDQMTINACVKDSIENLRPTLAAGIPELNVPSIEPFIIPEIIAVSGDLAQLKASGKNVKVFGASNFTIKSVNVDLETYTIRARIRFPKLHLEGRYKLDTRILIIPLRGQGNLVANAVKCDAIVVINSEIIKKEDIEYLKFKSLTVDLNLKDYNVKFDGLFNGDKTLEQATNNAINQNRDEFFIAMKPYLENTAAKVLLDTANKIVHSLTLDDLFPKP